MKIVHINCADEGSTGSIICAITKEADIRKHQSYLIVPLKKREIPFNTELEVCYPHQQGLYRRIAALLGYQYGFSPLPTLRILAILKKIKPDIVHLHSINCNMVNIYQLLRFLKKENIATVVTNHAEFFYTGSCSASLGCEKWRSGCGNCPRPREATISYWDFSAQAWHKMKQSFEGFKNIEIVSVSPWQYQKSCSSPIVSNMPQSCICNGVDTQVFQRHPSSLRKEHHNKKLVLLVTARFDPDDISSKGGAYFVQLAERFKNENIVFIVVGKTASINSKLPDNVKIIGPVSSQQRLAEYYTAADLTISVSAAETFGMTVVESLCCGTPVVGFCNGGSESIAIPEYSQFIPYGAIDDLELICRKKWLTFKTKHSDEIVATASSVYNNSRMSKQYVDLYERIIENAEDRNIDIS